MRNLAVTILTVLLIMSTGCGQQLMIPTASTEPVSTSTVESATQTSNPPKVLLYVLENAWDKNSLQQVITELAVEAGWVYEEKGSFDPADLTNETVMAVFLGAPGDMNLLAGKPDIAFIVITHAELQSAANISILSARPSDLAFIAGYVAELTAEDWRGGALIGNDGTYSESERVAFRNGGWYLCGLCNPKFPPYPGFPTVEQQSINSDWTSWQLSADILLANRVKVVYLAPEANSVEVSGYLARMGNSLIGRGAPPAGVEENWITSLNWQITDTFREEWDRLANGAAGQVVAVPVMLENTNETLLSIGKQRLVSEVIVLLKDGMIDTLATP